MENSREKELELVLTQIGISESAVKLYFLITSLGSKNFSSIAKQLQISRPHLYKLVSELELRGLLKWDKSTVGIQRLQPCSPTEILQKIREKKHEINSIEKKFVDLLPTLLETYAQGNQASKIKIISNEDDFLKLFFQIIEEENNDIEYFGSAGDLIGFISWEKERKWIQKRIKKGIFIKVLVLASDDTRVLQRADKSELRETRIFLSNIGFSTSYHIFGNKVVFWQPSAKNALLIEDEYIVQMMRSMFSFCWTNSAKQKRK